VTDDTDRVLSAWFAGLSGIDRGNCMTGSPGGRVLALAVVFITAGLALAAQAQALTDRPVWKCRASAGYTTVNGGDRAETIVANGNVNTGRGKDPDRALCGSSEAGGGNLPAPLGIPTDLLSASSASAVTDIDPELGQASAQRVGTLGRVENLALKLPGVGAVTLGAVLAESTAAGVCGGGAPQLTGASRVTGLTLNGSAVDTGTLASRLTAALASLNPVVDVKQDETIRSADALTIRALHVVIRLGSGVVIDTVVAEAKVGTDGMVCRSTTRDLCPQGSQYAEDRNLCIIFGGPQGDGGDSDIIVGRPFDGPAAGSVVRLSIARRRPYGDSPCLRGAGRGFAIIGSNRSDDLPGTRLDDRIIGLGGNDRIPATRGNDCIDGGRGADNLSGDVGNDRIYGGSGNDTINAGPGNDIVDGGPGNDSINAAFGADRIAGGPGRDYVNIATAGPPASANCGGGHDKIRFNRRERRSVHGCETRYMLHD
jgi:Ca2+-binding RTX toxin-like protein